MKQLAVGLAVLALGMGVGSRALAQDAGEGAIKASGCLKCHSVSAEKEGPSYKSVAAKYKGQADAAAKLEAYIGGHNGGIKQKDQTKGAVAYILSR